MTVKRQGIRICDMRDCTDFIKSGQTQVVASTTQEELEKVSKNDLPEHLRDLYERSVEFADETGKKKLIKLLWEFRNVFFETTGKLGCA